VVITTMSCYVVALAVKVLSAPFPTRGLALGVGIPSLAIAFGLTLWVASPAVVRWPRGRRFTALLGYALVTVLPTILLGPAWSVMLGFLAGASLLLFCGWLAWTLFCVTVAGTFAVALIGAFVVSDLTPDNAAFVMLSTVALGLGLFGLVRLSLLVRYADTRRAESVQLAVIRERMRFARDLHDLLGYSLSTITLRAEVTRRLVSNDPELAQFEVSEVISIARQALADVRAVSTGYRNISLLNEAMSVAPLLREGGIHARVEIDCGPLSKRVDTALATVLREAVTNMLQHSKVRNCLIEAGVTASMINLHIANDGVPQSGAAHREGGGLGNLATRMAAVGGDFTARIDPDGWFHLHAQCPFERQCPLE
jgi:two-component system sensor histidine kinase DesK